MDGGLASGEEDCEELLAITGDVGGAGLPATFGRLNDGLAVDHIGDWGGAGPMIAAPDSNHASDSLHGRGSTAPLEQQAATCTMRYYKQSGGLAIGAHSPPRVKQILC
jgi:hypothetical protein